MNQEHTNLLLNQLATKIGVLEVDNLSLQILVAELQKENTELKAQLNSETKGVIE